jgi:hypothetical protein
MHSQQIASITPIVIRYIDYLAYRAIFMCAMFPKIKLDVFSPEKPQMSAGGGGRGHTPAEWLSVLIIEFPHEDSDTEFPPLTFPHHFPTRGFIPN